MNKQWKHIPFGHARINREFDKIAPATCSRSDSIIAQYVFDKNYEVTIPERSDWIANNVVLNDEVFVLQVGLDLNTQVVQEQVCSLNHTISNKLYHLGIMLLSFKQNTQMRIAYSVCYTHLCIVFV